MPRPPMLQWRYFLLAQGLSYLLMAVSFLPLLLQYRFLFHGDKVLSSVADVPLLGTKLGMEILGFLAAQIGVYAVFGAVIWLLAALLWYAFRPDQSKPHVVVLGSFLLLAIAVFVCNASLFPWSALGESFWETFSIRIGKINIGEIVMLFLAAIVIATLIVAFARLLRSQRQLAIATLSGSVILTSIVTMAHIPAGSELMSGNGSADNTPNIILIGVDSLRPDFTAIGGDTTHTPHINEFISGGRAFRDVTTPLARTFPAWISILSGRHPHETGAIMNLTNRDDIKASPTLPEILRAKGYHTAFAIDETRFANIDRSYGFDQIIAPPMGAADFLLGTLNDTPLTNLIVETRMGRRLFPHSYANRAAAHLYEPDFFVRRLTSELDLSRPIFLAAHFTLPHFPYHWASAPKDQSDGTPHHGQTLYAATVQQADAQVGELLQFLGRAGALRNAIVVVLSDHGEALGSPSDSLVTDETRKVGDYVIPAARSGHGTSVLSPAQFQVVLAIRGYGLPALDSLAHESSSQPVSLEDLAPTLLDLARIDRAEYSFTGRSIATALRGGDVSADADRIRFTETEFNPPALLAGFSIETEVARQNAKYYHVDADSGLLKLREDMRAQVMAERQYAAIGKTYVLAAMPNANRGPTYVLASRDGSGARLVNGPDDLGTAPEVTALWGALHAKFSLRSSSN